MPPPPQPTPVKPKAAAPTAEKKVVKQDPLKAFSGFVIFFCQISEETLDFELAGGQRGANEEPPPTL